MAPNKRILVVEDDPDAQDVMALILRNAGYEVFVAATERSGLACIAEHPDIDVIITDACFGNGGSGLCMAEEIRQCGSTAPVIVISGDPAASCATLGPDAIFLLKPYGRKALLRTVAAAAQPGHARTATAANGRKLAFVKITN
jgi:CheY-like chemotaxis protein